jgi:putative Mg2+ transporter-C (MgtC) family protein
MGYRLIPDHPLARQNAGCAAEGALPMFDWIDTQATFWEIVVRLVISLVAGAIVGFEREWRDHPAGLRTHMLVALGSAGFTLIAMEFYDAIVSDGVTTQIDPLRVVQGVVGGVGFLGAGTIIQAGGRVRGLTTAAGLWAVAAVGVAAGGGHYAIALLMVALIIITLALIRLLEKPIAKHRRAVYGHDGDNDDRDDYRGGQRRSDTAHGPFQPRGE